MHSQPVRKRFDQRSRLISYKILRLLSNDRVIDGVIDLVGHVALVVIWPERDADGQSLRGSALFFRNPNARGNFQLLDMNLIGKRIGFVGHLARLPGC